MNFRWHAEVGGGPEVVEPSWSLCSGSGSGDRWTCDHHSRRGSSTEMCGWSKGKVRDKTYATQISCIKGWRNSVKHWSGCLSCPKKKRGHKWVVSLTNTCSRILFSYFSLNTVRNMYKHVGVDLATVLYIKKTFDLRRRFFVAQFDLNFSKCLHCS